MLAIIWTAAATIPVSFEVVSQPRPGWTELGKQEETYRLEPISATPPTRGTILCRGLGWSIAAAFAWASYQAIKRDRREADADRISPGP